MIDAVTSPEVATPVGPFSHAVRAGELLYLSGQVAQEPTTGKLLEGDVAAQAEQIFKNIAAVLRAAGKTPAQIVKITVYLTDMRDFAAMNAVYARQFSPPYPARTTIAVAALPLGAKIEIDAIAGL